MEKQKTKKEEEENFSELSSGVALDFTFITLAIFIFGYGLGVIEKTAFGLKTEKEKSDLLKKLPDFLDQEKDKKKFVERNCKA